MDNAKKIAFINLLIAILLTLGALCCGLFPLIALERCVPLFSHLYALLLTVYISLFIGLCLILLGGNILLRKSGVAPDSGFLRALLVADAIVITLFWQFWLNPIQVMPMLQSGIYTPVLTVAAVIALSWLPFLFILRKCF